jgi:hypothetical protein
VMSQTITYYASCQTPCPTFTNDYKIIVSNPCENSLVFTNHTPPLPNIQTFASPTTILSNAVLPSHSTIKYKAPHSITLNPGFITGTNTVFESKIGGCQ